MRTADVKFSGVFLDVFLHYFISESFDCDITTTIDVWKWRIFLNPRHNYFFWRFSVYDKIYNNFYLTNPLRKLFHFYIGPCAPTGGL